MPRTDQPRNYDLCICEHTYRLHDVNEIRDGKIMICEKLECTCEKFVFKHNPVTGNQ